METGLGSTWKGACNWKVARFMRSMRLAVKFAIYSTPRGWSIARSVASPPIGTRIPKVAGWAAPIDAAAIPRVANNNLRTMRHSDYPRSHSPHSSDPRFSNFNRRHAGGFHELVCLAIGNRLPLPGGLAFWSGGHD